MNALCRIGSYSICTVVFLETRVAIYHELKVRGEEKQKEPAQSRLDVDAIKERESSDSSSSSGEEDGDDDDYHGRDRNTSLYILRDNLVVSEVSWHFVAVCFVVSVTSSLIFVSFALGVTGKGDIEYDHYQDEVAQFVAPLSALFYVLSIFMMPKLSNNHYKRFLRVHFFAVPVVSELSMVTGQLKQGDKKDYWWVIIFCAGRLFFWYRGWLELLRLRKVISQLEGYPLSQFLTQVILKRGCGAILLLIFFSSKTLSCIMTDGGNRWFADESSTKVCRSSNFATLFLSANVIVYTVLSIAWNGVNDATLYELGHVRDGSLLSIDLKKVQKVQILLGGISLVSNPALLGALGTASEEGKEVEQANITFWIGLVGSLSGAVALVIEMRGIRNSSHKVSRKRNSEVEKMTALYKSSREFSSQQFDIEQIHDL